MAKQNQGTFQQEVIYREGRLVHDWRVAQLVRLGITESLAEVNADNVDWQDPSLPEPITGREAAAAFFTAAWSGFPDLQMQPIGEALVDEANRRICQEWRMVGTHTGEGFPPGVPPSGRPFDVTGTDIWQVDETGRAVCVHAYWNVATLLTQLGLT